MQSGVVRRGVRAALAQHVDDYPYIAARHAAYEALLREVLFHADSADEVLELSGASPGEGPLGAPEEAVLFGVEVPPAEAAAPCACRPPTPTLAARALELVRPSRREPGRSGAFFCAQHRGRGAGGGPGAA